MKQTKTEFRKAILAELDRLWNQANESILGMASEQSNPQVNQMIVKNQGFKLALEDVNQFIYSIK